MSYLAVTFEVNPTEIGSEILIALLAEYEFESFEPTPKGFVAYGLEDKINTSVLRELGSFNDFSYTYKTELIAKTNWNEEWEKNFHPVSVEDLCYIHASFHAPSACVKLNVKIEPKMSFGTGHHHTTWMMVKALFKLDLKNKSVLDMGCGTGILAIVAHKIGAAEVEGIDVDEWSIENSKENATNNECNSIHFFLGNASSLADKSYDVILANINKNTLLHDMSLYAKSLKEKGHLLLSGFFENDMHDLISNANQIGLNKVYHDNKESWAMLGFCTT